MQATAVQYKLIKKIKDERFDEELIHQYDLLIHIGTKDFQSAIIDSQSNRIVLLEDYVLPNINSKEEQLTVLDQIFDSHALLKAGFWKKIKVSVKNQKFVQVPQLLFVADTAENYLKFNAPLHHSDSVMYVENPKAEAVTVFSIWDDLKTWIQKTYPAKKPIFIHQSAAIIEGILRYASQHQGDPLYIYVDRFKLHVAYCKDGKLLYYNQFIIKQFSDYVKYIMLVMKSLGLDQQNSHVVLWGYIGKNSPHYHEFYKYIKNVTFGGRPTHLNYSYVFDEIQEHHFFDLYSMNLLG